MGGRTTGTVEEEVEVEVEESLGLIPRGGKVNCFQVKEDEVEGEKRKGEVPGEIIEYLEFNKTHSLFSLKASHR